MIELTDEQRESFFLWLREHIEEIGGDFADGFWVKTADTNEILHMWTPEYDKWIDLKKTIFMKNKK